MLFDGFNDDRDVISIEILVVAHEPPFLVKNIEFQVLSQTWQMDEFNAISVMTIINLVSM